MRLDLGFELLPAITGAMKSSNGEFFDGQNVCIYSEVPGTKQFVRITLDKIIFDAITRLSDDSIKKTRRSLKLAVKEAIRNDKWTGFFTVFLGKGAFDIAD